MDSRERVLLALEFQEPDRVPVDFWGSNGFYRVLERERGLTKEAFLERYDIDFRYIEGPSYIGPTLEAGQGIEVDLWAVPRREVTVPTAFGEEIYKEVTRYPLADAETVEEIDAYPHWPSPDWFDYSPIRRQCEAVRAKGRVVVFMGDRLNRAAQLKPAMYLRGVGQILVDLIAAPELAEAIFRHLRVFYGEYLRRILEAADGLIDIVLTGDDFGSQNGPLVSPPMWERFLAEGFGEYLDIIHGFGARSMHHTCGSVTSIVPGMVARGLRVLQSLQPDAMADDLPELKRRFGRKLAFHGGISIQRTLPRGTPDEVRDEVGRRVAVLASGGGYVLSTAHNVQADCPLANVEALLHAYRELGRYR